MVTRTVCSDAILSQCAGSMNETACCTVGSAVSVSCVQFLCQLFNIIICFFFAAVQHRQEDIELLRNSVQFSKVFRIVVPRYQGVPGGFPSAVAFSSSLLSSSSSSSAQTNLLRALLHLAPIS